MGKISVLEVTKAFGSVQKTADSLGINRSAVFKWYERGVPMYVALLMHISEKSNYTFNPEDYGLNPDVLSLNQKEAKHDQSTRNHRAS